MLADLISTIRENMAQGKILNEAAVSQGIVIPFLHELGWPVIDTSRDIPEYSLEGRRVDFALFSHADRPVIFIEVKAIGKASGADRQLFEYAFHKGVPLAVLTDGREWHFFLPAEEGEYQDRSVYKLDIIERSTEDIVKYLERYLQFDRVRSGQAMEAARKDYQNVSRKRKTGTVLPVAWSRLLQEKDEILLELLADKVEDLCGYKPELHDCSGYIDMISSGYALQTSNSVHSSVTESHLLLKHTKPSPVSSPPSPGFFTLQQLVQKRDLSNTKPSSFNINENKIAVRSWSDLCVKLVQWLLDNGRLNQSHIPVYNSAKRDKYFVNSKQEHANPKKDALWKPVGDIYVDVKYSVPRHVKNIINLIEHIGAEDLEIKICIRPQ